MRKPKKICFRNGLRLILAPQSSGLAATALILVKAGSEYETKNTNGISHFLEHMVFKGTLKRPRPGAIAEELAALGAQSNAFTGKEYTGYWAKAESRKLARIFEIVSDIYLHPIFVSEEIEKERGVILEEVNMYEDTPMRRVHDVFAGLLYGDQPAGWQIDGRRDVIKKLRREDLVAYRGERYVPRNTAVVVAGRFDERAVLRQAMEYFAGLGPAKSPPKPKTKIRQARPAVALQFKDSEQSHLVLGVRAFNMFHPARYTVQVLADILGGGMSSRLFKKIREEMGAAYYVGADADLYLDHGYLAVSAGVDHGKIGRVVGAVLGEMRAMASSEVGAKELQKSKDHIVGNMILGLETSDDLAGFYGSEEIMRGKTLSPEEIIGKIQGVEAGGVRRLAVRLFRDAGLNLAVIGSHKNAGVFRKILKF